jgi:transcriptional regulator with XRE-family HTH domain
MSPDSSIHEHVRGLVREAGLTHADIATRTGWSEQRVYRVLSGKTDLTAEDMLGLAGILGKPVADLYPVIPA